MKPIYYLLAGLLIYSLLVTGVAIVQHSALSDNRLAGELQKSVHENQVKQLEGKLTARATEIGRLKVKMDSVGEIHVQEQGRLKTQLNSLKRRERVSRGTDTVTLTLTDTVYLAYDSLVANLTADRDGIKRDCQTLTDSLIAQTKDFSKLVGVKNEQIIEAHQETRKEKRKNRFLKWTLGGAVGIIIYQGLKD